MFIKGCLSRSATGARAMGSFCRTRLRKSEKEDDQHCVGVTVSSFGDAGDEDEARDRCMLVDGGMKEEGSLGALPETKYRHSCVRDGVTTRMEMSQGQMVMVI